MVRITITFKKIRITIYIKNNRSLLATEAVIFITNQVNRFQRFSS